METLAKYEEKRSAAVRNELSVTDPDVSIAAAPAELPAQVMDPDIQQRIINALYATPQGVMRTNDSVAGTGGDLDQYGHRAYSRPLCRLRRAAAGKQLLAQFGGVRNRRPAADDDRRLESGGTSDFFQRPPSWMEAGSKIDDSGPDAEGVQ